MPRGPRRTGKANTARPVSAMPVAIPAPRPKSRPRKLTFGPQRISTMTEKPTIPRARTSRMMAQKLERKISTGAPSQPAKGPALLPAMQRAEPAWWKGNLHTHSFWSDGDDFPEMIADWYKAHGYHFLALSDHNVLSEGQRWLDVKSGKTTREEAL